MKEFIEQLMRQGVPVNEILIGLAVVIAVIALVSFVKNSIKMAIALMIIAAGIFMFVPALQPIRDEVDLEQKMDEAFDNIESDVDEITSWLEEL